MSFSENFRQGFEMYGGQYIYFESNRNAVNNGGSISILPSVIYSDKSDDNIFFKNH